MCERLHPLVFQCFGADSGPNLGSREITHSVEVRIAHAGRLLLISGSWFCEKSGRTSTWACVKGSPETIWVFQDVPDLGVQNGVIGCITRYQGTH